MGSYTIWVKVLFCFLLSLLFTVSIMSGVSAKATYKAPPDFDVIYNENLGMIIINTTEGNITLKYVKSDFLPYEKNELKSITKDIIKSIDSTKKEIDTPDEIRKDSKFEISGTLPYHLTECQIKYAGLHIDLCNNKTDDSIFIYNTGRWYSNISTAVYGSGTCNITGEEDYDSAALAIGYPGFYEATTDNFVANCDLTVLGAGTFRGDQGQNLTVNGEFYVQGVSDYHIDRGYLIMNNSDGTLDDFRIVGSYFTINGTAGTDVIPEVADTFDAGVIQEPGTDYLEQWDWYCDSGSDMLIQDAEIYGYDAKSLSKDCDKTIYRSHLSLCNHVSDRFGTDDEDIIRWNLFDDAYNNGGTNAVNFLGGLNDNEPMNHSFNKFDATGAGATSNLINYYDDDRYFWNSEIVSAQFYTWSLAGVNMEISMYNCSFTGDGSSDGLNLDNLVVRWGTYNIQNRVNVTFHLMAQITDNGADLSGATLTTYYKRYQCWEANDSSWQTGNSFTTDSDGQIDGPQWLLFYDAVANNESCRYLWNYTVNNSGLWNSTEVNFSSLTKPVFINLSLNSGGPPAKRNITEIIWNVTNNTVYNISNFTGHTMVYFNSTNETSEILQLYQNSTKWWEIAVANVSFITVNLTNLTWNSTSWYHWQSENNITANYSLTYINDSDYSLPPAAKRNITDIIWNVTNNTVYNISNFTGHTMVYFNSTNETSQTLILVENETAIYSVVAANVSFIVINLTNLTWNGTNWYQWQCFNNNSLNYSLRYINDSDYSLPPSTVEWQLIYTNNTNGSNYNLTDMDDAILYRYWSWNWSTFNITVYTNDTLRCHGNISNNTWTACNLSILSLGFYELTVNSSFNTTVSTFNITNTTGRPDLTSTYIEGFSNIIIYILLALFVFLFVNKYSYFIGDILFIGMAFDIMYNNLHASWVMIGFLIAFIFVVKLVVDAYNYVRWKTN